MMYIALLLQDPAALVERLRTGDIEARQRAEADLARIGAPAEAALDSASREADPEVASRARRLLLDVVAPHRREVDRAVRHLLVHLRTSIETRRTQQARALTGLLVRGFPDHPAAKDPSLADGVWESCGNAWWGVSENLRKLEGARFTHPPRDAWMQARGPLREAVAATLPAGSVCALCVEWRLETVKLGLAFENAKVEDILAHLRDVGGLNLILDAGMSGDPWVRQLEMAVTIEAKDVTLGEALKRVLAPYGMEAVVTEEGVVLARRSPSAR